MGRLRRNWRWAAGAVIVAAGAIGGWVGWLAPTGALSMDGNRYGTVRLVKPDGDERGTVIMFSGRDGWSAADQAAATALAQAGALVAGVDSRVYSDRLTQVDKTCHVLIGDAEALSREVQRLHGTQGYRSPILFGVGDGAALAEITLAQARPNTIAGAVSLDMDTPSVAAQACVDPATMKVDPQAAEHGPGTLQGFWTAGFRRMPGASWSHGGKQPVHPSMSSNAPPGRARLTPPWPW
jgi:type IV secretory pathway VirJ component